MLTWPDASRSTWSYSLNATQKMMDVTDSKQWIHFFRSERWPPTSNILVIIKEVKIHLSICLQNKKKEKRSSSNLLYVQLTHGESCLHYTGRLLTSSQHIVHSGYVILFADSSNLTEKTGKGNVVGKKKGKREKKSLDFYREVTLAEIIIFSHLLRGRIHEIKITSVMIQ